MSKKLLVPFGLCFALGGQDFNDSTFPSSIVLQGGLREDTITPTKGNFQATTFGYNRNPFLAISGQAGSQYLLTIKDLSDTNATSRSTTYYSGGFRIGEKIQVALLNVHTLAIQGGGGHQCAKRLYIFNLCKWETNQSSGFRVWRSI